MDDKTNLRLAFSSRVYADLERLVSWTRMEFSGFGFVRKADERTMLVYEFVLLDVGSYGYTEFEPRKYIHLLDRSDAGNMRIWIHRHPIGNGKPGWHNWSGTDNQTINETPLGGIPEMVRWSLSAVRTPGGWVGRIDNHISKQTQHLPVAWATTPGLMNKARELEVEYNRKLIERRKQWQAEEEAFLAEDDESFEASLTQPSLWNKYKKMISPWSKA